MAKRTLTVEIVGDPSKLGRAFRSTDKDAAKFQGSIRSTGRALGSLSKGAAAAGVAIGAGLVVEGARAVKAFEETRKVAAQTNAVLKSTGGAAKISAAGVADLATAISMKTGIDDEAVQSTENMLLTFTKVRDETGKGNKIFTEATKVATDMSVALGQDGTKSAVMLGKALNDPIKGVTALQRVGVTFTEDQKKQIKTLEDTGDHLGAQKIILRELNTEFKGSAEAQATPLQKAKVAAGNLEEALGKGLAPVVDTVLTKFTKLARTVEPQLNRLTKQISGTFKRDDIDLADKFTISWAKIKRKLAPFAAQAQSEIRSQHLGAKLSKLIEDAAPMIADAFAAAAPRAAGAFVRAFKEAGPWGKVVTVAFLLSKFGAFSSVGTLVATKFTTSLKKRMGITMPIAGATAGTQFSGGFATSSSAGVTAAASKGGKMRGAFSRAGGMLGSTMGVAAAGLFGVELAKGVEKVLSDKLPGGNKSNSKRPTGTPGTGWNLFDYIKDKVGDGAGKVVDKVTGAFPGQGLPQGGAFGGSLMGARPSMKPFAAIGSRFGLTVTSGRRPGAITSSGNQSWHGTGEAIDMSGSASGMLSFAKTLRKRFGGRLAELIHTPMGAGIKNGQPYRYGGQVAADHYDHVHVAFDSGRPGIGDGLGKFDSTSYGPPWGGINGTGVTATGINLKGAPHRYGVAVDPSVIPLGTKLKINPNPFGYSGFFEAFDTGGGIKGKHIDFYDWRGHAKQNAWGHKKVTISTAKGGAHGGGPGSGPKKGALYLGPRSGTVGPSTGGLSSGMTVSGGQSGADFGLAEATARASDNLPGLIAALSNELRAKRRRLKRVKKLLRRKRIKASTRQALTEEATQLVTDIGDLAATLKEYKADAKGGATTISGAEELTAGVSGDGPASPADFANLAIAEAALTPGLDDDKAALNTLLGIRQGELTAARATGDPRKILEALAALTEVTTAINNLTDAMTGAAELAQNLADVKVELKAIHDAADTMNAVGYATVLKFMADQISSQVVGTNLQGRRQTAGNGRVAITP